MIRARHSTIRILLAVLMVGQVCLNVGFEGRSAFAQFANLSLAQLETDAAPQPLGIDDRNPRLSWALVSATRGVLQTAYRVVVASQRELAREGRANIWDSGQVASADPWVVYAGPPLKSRTRYYWSVRVWSTHGLSSAWSEPQWFETALLNDQEWQGY